ncbi:MAG: NADH-quinone oxidoreductase subunit NuoK [Deltaproteobacteria bacterium]|nr:NADH-quinone oxidoreductase subunit NuoK [Deltaproteobacteria bacterium]
MVPIGVPVEHVIALAVALFVIGVLGVLLRKSVIVMLMSVELMLNAANLLFVVFAERWGVARGQTISFFVMAVAAAEAAVGLAILIGVFRTHNTTDVDELRDLLEQS